MCYGQQRGDLRWQETLAPISTVFESSGLMKPWTKPFHVCVKCDAIWAVSFNPKDITYVQTRTPAKMKSALSPDATLEDLMVPLFAWAPVDEMTEYGLGEIDYDPQELFDRLVAAWRHPEIEVARQSDILRQLTRLSTAHNPIHAKQREAVGWLIEDFRGFEVELAELERVMPDPQGPWAPTRGFAERDLADLQRLRSQSNVLRGAEPPSLRSPPINALSQTCPPPSTAVEPPPAAIGIVDETVDVGVVERTRQLLRHPLEFGPGVLFAWLFVERIGSQVGPSSQPAVIGFFFAMALVFPGVVVARTAGATDMPWWLAVWRRVSVVADYLMFALIVFVIVLGAAGLATVAGIQARIAESDTAVLLISATTALVLIRLWPFMIVPYFQPIEADVPDTQAIGFWKHSAISTAWKLTRSKGTFRLQTLPWLAATLTAVALTVGATYWGGVVGRSLVLYPIVLPAMTAFTWALVEQLELTES